ncbi:hypothetical protein DPMN_094449 [Dreissena polymorpha]|uniref:Uncharacterized protein n=1 Tax=Dreissena polymorpha TaxID=45954 RepID=A0A9D4L5I8_DREPO|nr:hypothetical protein DPMN_094449 [Dreissena polymorpha]
MIVLADQIENGTLESRTQFPDALRDFFQFRDDHSVTDGVILYNDRIVIPPLL